MAIPEIFLLKEKNILQKQVDNLIEGQKKQGDLNLKNKKNSLKNLIIGKKGIIRGNILGKRVDISGRSVISVEPKINLNEIVISKIMAKNLFQPILIKKMLQLKITRNNIKYAKLLINDEKKSKLIQTLLNEIIKNYIVILNRAPTLHRVNIQAFHLLINNNKTIQLNPLICSAFNADFDGDQMGIHIPLSLKAQAEARTLLIASNQCNSVATGEANIIPSQDMIIGLYFLSSENTSIKYLFKKILRIPDMKNLKINNIA